MLDFMETYLSFSFEKFLKAVVCYSRKHYRLGGAMSPLDPPLRMALFYTLPRVFAVRYLSRAPNRAAISEIGFD